MSQSIRKTGWVISANAVVNTGRFSNFRTLLCRLWGPVSRKYFYVLRPILAYKWIKEKRCPPPVLFQELYDAVLETEMKPLIEDLKQQKMQMTEAEKGPVIPEINQWIEKNLSQMERELDSMERGEAKDWDPLNLIFKKLLL